jgi:heme-degrading monooxygenase HmoA
MATIEITVFSLRPDADDESFLAADRSVQTELVPNQPGFMRRTTARRGDTWLVLTLWRSWADAEAFEILAHGHAVHMAFEGHIDPTSQRQQRFETLD